MEITIDAQQKDDATGGVKDPIFVAKFVCVTISPDYKAGPCVPVKPETPEDQRLFEMGESKSALFNYAFEIFPPVEEKLGQDMRRKTDLTRVPPTEEEVAVLRALQLPSTDPITLRRAKAYSMPSNQVPMASTYFQTTNICMPTEVNAHLKLFGGFQLRTAYDSAYQLADKFVGGKPLKFLCTTNGSFLRPVDVGSMLYRDTQICYTDGKYIQIYVTSYVHNTRKNAFQVVNKFNFTFEAADENLCVSCKVDVNFGTR
ncbi:acyl-CoA thioesterase [Aphelenchoides avenae]|nr:acyl-CoA thioesterase [Aphelenchus avenae]